MKRKQVEKEQLGIDKGTASNKLKKQLLFHYVKLAGHDTCHRCGEKIADVDDFSVEHKVDWLHSKDPVKLFYNVDNIAFSHLHCNTKAGKKPERKHGKSGYMRGCRCETCRAGNYGPIKAYRERKKLKVPEA